MNYNFDVLLANLQSDAISLIPEGIRANRHIWRCVVNAIDEHNRYMFDLFSRQEDLQLEIESLRARITALESKPKRRWWQIWR